MPYERFLLFTKRKISATTIHRGCFIRQQCTLERNYLSIQFETFEMTRFCEKIVRFF